MAEPGAYVEPQLVHDLRAGKRFETEDELFEALETFYYEPSTESQRNGVIYELDSDTGHEKQDYNRVSGIWQH